MIKICGICGEEFLLKHPNQKYCKAKCRVIARKRSFQKFNEKRQATDGHKEYMAQYMFSWRRRYRKGSYKAEKGVLGTGTTSNKLKVDPKG